MHTLKNVDYFFFPERLATVKETLAFMVRCLENDIKDYNKTFELAKEYGLINSEMNLLKNRHTFVGAGGFFPHVIRVLKKKKKNNYFPRKSKPIWLQKLIAKGQLLI